MTAVLSALALAGSAGAQAKASGKPLAVSALTTDTLQVTAEPDCTFTMTSNGEA